MRASVRLFLVRHGETDWNAAGRLQGHADRPLSERGREQAARAAERFAGIPFAAAVSSDLARARETASILGSSLGLEARPDPRLREIHFGKWEGLTLAEVRARSAGGRFVFDLDPLDARAPGGESARDVAARVFAAADDLARAAPGERVMLVAHALPIALLRCRARGLPLAGAWKSPLRNLGFDLLDWPPGEG